MSYNAYGGYGGNPYGAEQQQAGGYGASNPYGGDAGNPYGGEYGQAQSGSRPQEVQHQASTYTQDSQYSQQASAAMPTNAPGHAPHQNVQYVQAGPATLSNPDFLSRVEAVKADIRTLTTHVGQIGSLHQRSLSSADTTGSSELESIITQTQVLNTSIKDQIKFLETDAARSKDNNVKNTQVGQLKTSFAKQLQEYRVEEANYEKRYREQIARQYRIVNPEATDAEVQEATQADWGNEGVFQTALKTNRSATANTVLGAVRARHNDILKIEKTLMELNQLMEDLATAVVLQDEPIQAAQQHTENVKKDTEAGNVHLDKGIDSARRARKLKWICFWIVVAILCILALILGLYFGLTNRK
ncbi:Protein transport protein SSO2 [Teratosphaeria destructans]|uniref:Protein transport protein SSO2 n=1 Tax=Teratosphaeria destructans TaxID=418781 RepID=A0A9W7SNW0_9PEZI|nr:Protein transport protein SSO2 [Teratosphaeria destructans]